MISDGLFRQVGLFSTELPVGGAREYTWLPIAMFVLALFSQKLTDLDVFFQPLMGMEVRTIRHMNQGTLSLIETGSSQMPRMSSSLLSASSSFEVIEN